MSFVLQSVGFRHQKSGPAALSDLSVTFPAGEPCAVLGISGSGKSTLLNLLSRLWDGPPSAGRITYEGRNGGEYSSLTARESARLRRDHFGFVLQSAFLIRHLTCWENVEVPLAIQGMPATEREKRIQGLFEFAGMEHLHRRKARLISGGEQQRIAILRAIVHDPDVLFADEPFSSLDPMNTDLIIELFRSWLEGHLYEQAEQRNRTLILVTHDIPSAWKVVCSDEIRPKSKTGSFLLLEQGRALGNGLLRPAQVPGGPSELRRLIVPNITRGGNDIR